MLNIDKGTLDLRVESVCHGAFAFASTTKTNYKCAINSKMSPTSKTTVVKQFPGCCPSLELGLKAFANAFLSTNFTIGININFEKTSSSARVSSIRSPKHQLLSRESAKKRPGCNMINYGMNKNPRTLPPIFLTFNSSCSRR